MTLIYMAHVLLIGNTRDLPAGLQKALEEIGFRVSIAECVFSGLESALSHHPNLILGVEPLIGLDACDLLELGARDSNLCNIPILICSTWTKQKLECFNRGCADFILLPVEKTELLYRIHSALRSRSSRGISGDFSAIELLDLIQMLVQARRTGALEVSCSEIEALLCFDHGQMSYASYGLEQGEDALLGLLREAKDASSFCFRPLEEEEREINIQKPIEHLLLSAANTIDEEQIRAKTSD